MIVKRYGKFYGECDICCETTDGFDTWEECRDFIKENWHSIWNHSIDEWENLCEDCSRLR